MMLSTEREFVGPDTDPDMYRFCHRAVLIPRSQVAFERTLVYAPLSSRRVFVIPFVTPEPKISAPVAVDVFESPNTIAFALAELWVPKTAECITPAEA
jgi:hypothetical protein